jgi:hypothetical protein
MTDGRATAKTQAKGKATAKEEADPCGMTDRKARARATATANATATAKARANTGVLRFAQG